MKLGICNAPSCAPVSLARYADEVIMVDETSTAVTMVLAMLRPVPPPLPYTSAGVLRRLDALHGAA